MYSVDTVHIERVTQISAVKCDFCFSIFYIYVCVDKIGFCQASADLKTFRIHYTVHWSCEPCRVV